MIGKLSGIIDSIFPDHFIVNVGGVGYMIFASSKLLSSLQMGISQEFWIDTHVREDHIHLYGFSSIDEKNAFIILQSVKGVGTKAALNILSHLSPIQIQNALLAKDYAAFTAVSGVGKKLAERIVTELKDKAFNISNQATIGVISRDNNHNHKGISVAPLDNDGDVATDAILALTSLGISRSDAYVRVSNALSQNPEMATGELIKIALANKG